MGQAGVCSGDWPTPSDSPRQAVKVQHQSRVVPRDIQHVPETTQLAKRQECHRDAAQSHARLALLKPRHGTLRHAHARRKVGHGKSAFLACNLDVATESTQRALNGRRIPVRLFRHNILCSNDFSNIYIVTIPLRATTMRCRVGLR